jgi:hypothetical protein
MAADVFASAFSGVAPGRGSHLAAPYRGNRHPLVFIGDEATKIGWPLPAEMAPAYFSDVQLVATASQDDSRQVASCGNYEGQDSQGNTVSGIVERLSDSVTFTIIVASTGRVVGRSTFTNMPQDCPSGLTELPQSGPPWLIQADSPTYGADNVTAWVNGYLTGPPR